eukprot:2513501-Lingulodinium_polyedra.AAC.1
MYGLRPRSQKYCNTFIRKPWRIACLNSSLPDTLNKRCDGQHLHHPCEGQDTLLTQGYTDEICQVIRDSIRRDEMRRNGRQDAGRKSFVSVCAPAVEPDTTTVVATRDIARPSL